MNLLEIIWIEYIRKRICIDKHHNCIHRKIYFQAAYLRMLLKNKREKNGLLTDYEKMEKVFSVVFSNCKISNKESIFIPNFLTK